MKASGNVVVNCRAIQPEREGSQLKKVTVGTLLIALLLAAPIAFADTLTGKVVKVTDGDSITVLDNTNIQHRIRLQGIDAPERGQPYGNASRKHLASLVARKEVIVKWAKRDRYRRIVGFVIVAAQEPDAAVGASTAL